MKKNVICFAWAIWGLLSTAIMNIVGLTFLVLVLIIFILIKVTFG